MTTAILNQHFQSRPTLLGGGHKKEYAVYARENDDNYGRPLSYSNIINLKNLIIGYVR